MASKLGCSEDALAKGFRRLSLVAPKFAKNTDILIKYLMDLVIKWKTTNKPEGPTGLKRKGTFRDISLSHYIPEFVDNFDHTCIQRNINRSQLMAEAEQKGKFNFID